MKTKLIVLTVLSLAPWLRGLEIPVIDAHRLVDARLQHMQVMKEFKAVQDRQDQQITVLTQQLAQLTFLAQVLGDPLTNNTLAGGASVIEGLSATGVDRSRSDILGMADAALSFVEGALDIYQTVGETFKTYDGKLTERDTNAYRPFAAIMSAVANHDAVAQNVKERRERLRTAMRDTVQRIAQANTSTEVQKLQAILSAQLAEIESADRELEFATGKAVIQDLENRNDRDKQAQARTEEQAAELAATMSRVGDVLRPNTAPLRLKK